MAEIVPFPLSRRRAYILRQAQYMATTLKAQKAVEYVARQIETQARVMRKRGIGEAVIAAELSALEAAIWIAFRSFGRRAPGGAA